MKVPPFGLSKVGRGEEMNIHWEGVIRRKLFFEGKVSYNGKYHSKHTFHEGCPFEQKDEEQQPSTEQNENREQQDLSEATPELHQNAETLLKEMRWSKTMLLQDS